MYVRDGIIYNEEDTPSEGSNAKPDSLNTDDKLRLSRARGSQNFVDTLSLVIIGLLGAAFLISKVFPSAESIGGYVGVPLGALILIRMVAAASHNDNVRQVRKDEKRRRQDDSSGNGWYD